MSLRLACSKPLLLYPLLFALIGCVNTSELTLDAQTRASLAEERLLSEPTCCSTFKEMTYETISSSRTKVEFGQTHSSVYNFDSGKSYYFAIHLPEITDEKAILLRSEMVNGGRNSIPTVFAPHVLFLNADYKPTQPASEISLCFHRGWTEVGYFGRIEEAPSSAEYAVIFTDFSSLAGSIPYSTEASSFGGGLMSLIEAEYDFPKSPEGLMDIWIDRIDSLPRSMERKCWSK